MIETGLSSVSERDTVRNVLIYVSDSLRYDYLPEFVAELGVSAEAIAPSTFTASSIPSLTTGLYPASHSVWMFDDTLPDVPPILDLDSHKVGFDAEGIWIDLPPSQKPPLRINRMEEQRKLSDLSAPYVHFVHDMGPHAPYGFDNGEFDSTKEFFAEHERDEDSLESLYSENAETSARRFLELYRDIELRGELDETLLVFTSDHGEALGEVHNGGRFGHGHPLSPETVRIPIVFCGAGLPTGERYDGLLSGTDIAPTVLRALGESGPDTDGVDVWGQPAPDDRLLRSEVWQHKDVDLPGKEKISVYSASSTWDEDGGYVMHRKSTPERIGSLTYDNLFRGYSPAWRSNVSLGKVKRMTELLLGSEFVYGSPDHSRAEAIAEMPDAFTETTDRPQQSLNQSQKDHLKDMGYL